MIRSLVAAALAFHAGVEALVTPKEHGLLARTPGDCAAQPAGTGPVTNNPDTAAAFLANPIYSQTAGQAPAPQDYSLAFSSLQASVQASSYLGYGVVSSYDPGYCASQCANMEGCVSFNIFFERDPTLDPGANCPNPASLTNIKCSYWGVPITNSQVTNAGQMRTNFQVAIAGSNGYVFNGNGTPPSGPLMQCPQPLLYVIPAARTVYAACLDTDYQIPSPQILFGVESNRDCGSACDAQSGCTKAVFNLGDQTCYLKGSPSVADANWRNNTGFQTVSRVPDGTHITSCPNSYTIVQNGVTWTACPGTTIAYSSPDIWYSVNNEYACAALCQGTAGCQNFSYNFNTQTCYNDANVAMNNTNWVINAGTAAYYIS